MIHSEHMFTIKAVFNSIENDEGACKSLNNLSREAGKGYGPLTIRYKNKEIEICGTKCIKEILFVTVHILEKEIEDSHNRLKEVMKEATK